MTAAPRSLLLALAVAGVAVAGACQQAGVAPLEPGVPGSSAGGTIPVFRLPDAGAGDGPTTPTAPGGSQCAEEAFQGAVTPVDIMLLVDSSGSMANPAGMTSKWALAYDALVAFVRDPGTAGFGVGLQFFPAFPPVATCMADRDCSPVAGVNLPDLGFFCLRRNLCVAADGKVLNPQPCDPATMGACPMGSSCLPAGRCSVSGDLCGRVGQPCPGGPAGDRCAEVPRRCRQLATTGACTAAAYNMPKVAIGQLPGAELSLRRALEDAIPEGQTPMIPAVSGVLEGLQAHLRTRPDRRAVLVLTTDGVPEGCGPAFDLIDPAEQALAAALAASPSIPTYVIGVYDLAQAANHEAGLTRLARAGGTNTAFVIDPNASLATKLLEALTQIRGASLGCDFQIPRPATGAIDYNKVNVRVGGAGGLRELTYVGSADRCDPARGGWYYDVLPTAGTPTRILVCASTCREIKDDRTAKVELRIGCRTRVD